MTSVTPVSSPLLVAINCPARIAGAAPLPRTLSVLDTADSTLTAGISFLYGRLHGLEFFCLRLRRFLLCTLPRTCTLSLKCGERKGKMADGTTNRRHTRSNESCRSRGGSTSRVSVILETGNLVIIRHRRAYPGAGLLHGLEADLEMRVC
jgi:hypothetical protein